MNNDNTIMNIDGKDIEFKPAVCYGWTHDKWFVSRCGKLWSLSIKKELKPSIKYSYSKWAVGGRKISRSNLTISTPPNFWPDGSGRPHSTKNHWVRDITVHKIVMDTWKPLYDNPPLGVSGEFWKIGRDYPDNLRWYSESVAIDHIDDNPLNNDIDNLRRVSQWDNNPFRKKNGI